jgi:ectoine hydroxylase-related dioxygenase (phytanoyl-CoA dioxygenase family)
MARYPSKFCSTHTPSVSAPAVSAAVFPRQRPTTRAFSSSNDPLSPYRNNKTLAYCQNFSLSSHNKPCLEAIQSIISKQVDSALTDFQHASGVRQLLPFHKTVLKEILPLLLLVVVEATKVVAFPLKDSRIHAPVVVVAPETSIYSNAWTKGTLHRDFDCIETPGVYSFLLFLDEVTPENGTVAFWRHSKSVGPIDPRHPERALDQAGLTSELLLGKEGTVYVWDARLLHRSLANRTQKGD